MVMGHCVCAVCLFLCLWGVCDFPPWLQRLAVTRVP